MPRLLTSTLWHQEGAASEVLVGGFGVAGIWVTLNNTTKKAIKPLNPPPPPKKKKTLNKLKALKKHPKNSKLPRAP